jgi:NTP pyrophosphatase (non-canonical NTP hydrolase)
MKIETVLARVMNEIDRAEKIHPAWPRDVVKAASLCSEECGELVRAANTFDETRTGRKDIVTEAIHTAATAIRLLKNIEETEENVL